VIVAEIRVIHMLALNKVMSIRCKLSLRIQGVSVYLVYT